MKTVEEARARLQEIVEPGAQVISDHTFQARSNGKIHGSVVVGVWSLQWPAVAEIQLWTLNPYIEPDWTIISTTIISLTDLEHAATWLRNKYEASSAGIAQNAPS